ncbi:MAG: hypothetical protein R2939_09360 [Kofleriaceae bacterium]
MSQPRQVLRSQFYLITRTCTQRQYLLRPDDETTNAFTYCLAEAAKRFGIDVVISVVEANHHHTVIFDRDGRYPEFIEHLHKMFARCQNARLGRWENLWSSEEACVTRLVDRETVIAKVVYAASNPVKDGLVERATQWPGLNGYRQLLSGAQLRAHRPRHFFRADGRMPAVVTLRLVIPPELGDAREVVDAVRDGVEEVERRQRELRARTGARVVGRARLRRLSWRDAPQSERPRRGLRPRFAGGVVARVDALSEYREFLAAYRTARREWLEGRAWRFPPGTYWLARFTPVTCAPPSA